MSFLSQLLTFINSCGVTDPPLARISDQYADVSLVNQFGVALPFRRSFLDGRALIVTPMYTTCRGSCPTTNGTLKTLREQLTPIFGKQLSIVSFTLEPKVDTPEVLLKYARRFGADKQTNDLCDWHFTTGSPEAIESLRRSLGFFDLDPKVDQDITRHDATLLIGNSQTDRWTTLPAGLRQSHLLETIRRVAGVTLEQRFGISG